MATQVISWTRAVAQTQADADVPLTFAQADLGACIPAGQAQNLPPTPGAAAPGGGADAAAPAPGPIADDYSNIYEYLQSNSEFSELVQLIDAAPASADLLGRAPANPTVKTSWLAFMPDLGFAG